MNDNFVEDKLTPAAQEVMSEVVDEFKNRLLNEANKNASDITGEVKEISVRDILEALQKLESPIILKRSRRLETYLSIYTLTGILMAVVSYIYVMMFPSGALVDFFEIFILVGLVLSFMSILIFSVKSLQKISIGPLEISKKDEDFDTKDYSMHFVLLWSEIELLSREIVSYYIGESNVDNLALRELMSTLLKFDVFSAPDANEFLRLLDERNFVVHSKKVEMSREEFFRLEASAKNLIKKLSNKKNSLY